MRLIDADALKEKICYFPNYSENGESVDSYVVFADDLYDAPTIDAVPVVRCRECKYHSEGQCYHPNHDHHVQSVWVEDDHFCGWVQRREDGDGDG